MTLRRREKRKTRSSHENTKTKPVLNTGATSGPAEPALLVRSHTEFTSVARIHMSL